MKSFSFIQTGIADRKLDQSSRGKCIVRLQQSLECQKRLIVERNGQQILVLDPGFFQNVPSRMNGE